MKHLVNVLLFIAAMSYGQAQTIDPSNMADVKAPHLPKVIRLEGSHSGSICSMVIVDSQGNDKRVLLTLPPGDSLKGAIKSGMFPVPVRELMENGWTPAKIKALNKDTLWNLTVEYGDGSYYEYQTVWHSKTKLHDVIIRFGRYQKTDYGMMATEEWAYYIIRSATKGNILYDVVATFIHSVPTPLPNKG